MRGIAMTDTPAFFRDDRLDDATAPTADHRQACQAAEDTLAPFAVAACLTRTERRRIERGESLALVVVAPSADWVDPIREAFRQIGTWTLVVARNGSSKSEDKPERGNERIASILSQGGSVLGVSQAPERYLPAALCTGADMRLRVEAPSNDVIALVIRAATGQRPGAMPPRIAGGLGYLELISAIRTYTTARSCIGRLVAAAAAKAIVDVGVTEATPFETLRGYGVSHAWGMRLISEIEDWRRGKTAFHDIDRNVVLASDPGLGKSTYVRSLAKSAKLPLVVTSAASWFANSNGYLDGVIKQVDAAFANAVAMAPAILFIDEIDGIPNRATMSDRAIEWWTPLVTHILLTIDSITAQKINICMIGAPNFGERLDAALIRPGRLTRLIRIDPPSTSDLAGILRQHLGKDLIDLDLRPVGELGAGATGAQAAGWVKEARGRARSEGRALQPADLLAAVAPPESRSPGLLRRAALHEAGHSCCVEKTGSGRITQVTLVSRGDAAATTLVESALPSSPTRAEIERHIVTLLAGRAAEIVILGEASAGAGGSESSDLGLASNLLAGIHGSYGLAGNLTFRGPADLLVRHLNLDGELKRAVEADLTRLQAAAVRFVTDHVELVEAVADRLIADRFLSGDDLRALVASHSSDQSDFDARRR